MATSILPPPTNPSSTQDTFPFPGYHSFPPFFSPQPTLTTHTAQLRKWSSLVQKYFAHHKLHTLSISNAANLPLFHNPTIRKRASPQFIMEIVDFMASPAGETRAEWLPAASSSTTISTPLSNLSATAEKSNAWIFWRYPEEWADLLLSYVESKGQKGSVLTLYEIVQGEGSENTEFHGLDMRVLQRALGLCVKRGKAQVFGGEGEEGVKFF